MDLICESCGVANPPGTEFCEFCGAYLAWDRSVLVAPRNQPPAPAPTNQFAPPPPVYQPAAQPEPATRPMPAVETPPARPGPGTRPAVGRLADAGRGLPAPAASAGWAAARRAGGSTTPACGSARSVARC